MLLARARALANSGRILIRLLIFSEQIRVQCAWVSASIWICNSCWAVLHLA